MGCLKLTYYESPFLEKTEASKKVVQMFMSVDPMADKYPSMSPYMYCAGNPIRYIDPTGMIIDEASMSEQTKTDIAEARKNPKFEERYQKLEKSKHTYVFNYKEGKGDGGFSTDGEKLNISYSHDTKSVEQKKLSGLFHEIEHARQFEDGELGFELKNNVWSYVNYDIMDEVKAWRFGGESPGSDPIINKRKWGEGNEIKAAKYLNNWYGTDDNTKQRTSYGKAYDLWINAGSPLNGINNTNTENIKDNTKFMNVKKP